MSIKVSKDGVLSQVVPEINKLKNKYTILWNQKSNDGYIKICAVLQKYIDQSISANTSYNPENYSNNKVPMSVLIGDLLTAYKYGLKNLYYMNTMDSSGEINVNAISDNKKKQFILPEIVDDEDCDSCKI